MTATIHFLEFQEMLKNSLGSDLSEEEKVRLKEVFTPKGSCPVSCSKNFVFIISQLLMGEMPQTVSEMLDREHKEYIAPFVIRDYMVKHVPPDMMRSHFILRWMTKSESVDEVSILEALTKIQFARVVERMDQHVMDEDDRESRRREIQLLGKLATTSLKMKIAVGRVNIPPQQHEILHKGETTQNVKVNIQESTPKIDPRSAARVLQTLGKIEEIQPLLDDEPN